MAKYIVTGGAGFIGAHLTKRLLNEGHSVVSVDSLSTGQTQNIDPKADFIEGDISDKRFVFSLPVEGVKGVFHLAAQSSGEISFENPLRDLEINAGGTLLLLDWCRKNRVPRFIFSSSMGVYGTESDKALSEDSPKSPKSFYGAAKLAAENYINIYSGLGVETTVIRLFNVYGPFQNMENTKQGMASIYMSYILKDEPITVKGSMDRFRDQTYIGDVIEGIISCLCNPVSIGKTYNIATGKKSTVRELLKAMLKASGKPADYPVKIIGGTPGDIFGCYADISKAKTELEWSPRYGLEDGLREMYRHYSVKR